MRCKDTDSPQIRALLCVTRAGQTATPPEVRVPAQAPGIMELYFIDTEGGQSVLIVSPANGILGARETLLIDAGGLNVASINLALTPASVPTPNPVPPPVALPATPTTAPTRSRR